MGIVFQHYEIQGLIYVFWITLQGVFLEYESKSYETLVSSIEAHPSKAVQAVLKSFLGKIYKRQKQGFQQKEEGGWRKLRIFLNVTQCLDCPSGGQTSVPVSQCLSLMNLQASFSVGLFALLSFCCWLKDSLFRLISNRRSGSSFHHF